MIIKDLLLVHYGFEDCNRKLKLTDYVCKCNKIFCKIHRLPENHECVYDYKENNNKQKTNYLDYWWAVILIIAITFFIFTQSGKRLKTIRRK